MFFVRMKFTRALTIPLGALIAASAALAPARADMKEILASGVIRIGSTMDNPPYGYYDADRKPAGLDINLGQALGKALGVKVRLEELQTTNRIPYLLSGKVDVLIAAFGLLPERATQVMYTAPYSNSIQGVWGPSSLKVTGPQDVGSYKIGVGLGTISDKALTLVVPDANIVRYSSDTTTVTSYLSGQTDMAALSKSHALDVNKENLGKAVEMKFPLQTATTAHMAVRFDEPLLLQYLNTYIFYLKTDGELGAMYKKSFGYDLAPLPSL
jgi:polar amino acid transport system substrate-binding protein